MRTAILVLDASDVPLELDPAVLQGSWTEEQYLRLTNRTNRLVELVDGWLDTVPMPTDEHQGLPLWLVDLLRVAIGPTGVVRVAPLRLRIGDGRYRAPDLLALRSASDPRRRNDGWHGADLVVEIVNTDDPDRDYVEKRAEYAAARIPEYWIVVPARRAVTVLTLVGTNYVTHVDAATSGLAISPSVPGLALDVVALFAAAPAPPA